MLFRTKIELAILRSAVLVVLILIVSCKKDQDSHYFGRVSAMKNGSAWVAKAFAGRNTEFKQLIDVIGEVYNEQGFLRESIYFSEITLTQSRQNLYYSPINNIEAKAGAAYYTSTDDGDVGCDSYYLVPADSSFNYIELTGIDPLTRIISGKFVIRLVLEKIDQCDPNAKDTILFTNGKFVTRYFN